MQNLSTLQLDVNNLTGVLQGTPMSALTHEVSFSFWLCEQALGVIFACSCAGTLPSSWSMMGKLSALSVQFTQLRGALLWLHRQLEACDVICLSNELPLLVSIIKVLLG